MAAIDRVVHHSVILDMMAVDSFRAEAANHQHLRDQEETAEKPAARSLAIRLTVGWMEYQ
ncbi:MAG TPA: hypothetical protein VHD63_24125 [Ktedonobacteraceae bacterium]|nr:hypothetical protein [Ktedonobacteraceae bacterium]